MKKKLSLLIVLILALGSCTITKYVEVPVDRVQTEYKTITKYDSIYNRDSIYVREKEDTLIVEKYKYLYNTTFKTDTLTRIDTVTSVKVIEKEKEVNQLYTWQIILMVLGGAGLAYCIYKIVKLIK